MTGVSVNGVAITEHDIALELQYHPAGSVGVARHEATRALVVRELLLQQARRVGLHPRGSDREGDADLAIRALTESQVPVPPVDVAECRRYYDENPGRFLGPELFEASHILFAVAPNAPNLAEVRARAALVLAEVLSQPQRFETIARVQSACPSGSSGGRLGQISMGETQPAFELGLKQLEPGEISKELVQTRHGLHVVRLENRAAVSVLPFVAVEEKIRIYLRDRAWRRSVRLFVSALASEADVRGFDLDALPPEVAEGGSVQHLSGSGQAGSPQGRVPRRLPLVT
jgi:peptidyl-prolyl cis-trans isomerase C